MMSERSFPTARAILDFYVTQARAAASEAQRCVGDLSRWSHYAPPLTVARLLWIAELAAIEGYQTIGGLELVTRTVYRPIGVYSVRLLGSGGQVLAGDPRSDIVAILDGLPMRLRPRAAEGVWTLLEDQVADRIDRDRHPWPGTNQVAA